VSKPELWTLDAPDVIEFHELLRLLLDVDFGSVVSWMRQTTIT
jgi:hypothetical protein